MKSQKNILFGIMAFGLGIRLLVAILTTSWVFPSDGHFWQYGYEMGQVAASLALGNGFSWPEWSNYPHGPTSWMAPAYPLIMAGVFKVFGIYSMHSAMALEFLLSLASVLTCILVYVLGKHLYNAQTGLIGAFLLAIYPPAIFYSVRSLWDTSIFTCCLLLVVLLFLKLADAPTLKRGSGLGLILGVTALINPIIICTYPFALAWLYLKADGNRILVLKTIGLMLTAFCLAISPWLVRNYLTFGQFTFIKSNFGNELYVGIKQYLGRDNGDESSSQDIGSVSFRKFNRTVLEESNEVTRNGFLLRQAMMFIAEHPLRFAQQVMRRFARYWTFMRPYPGWQATISLTIYLTVLLLALAGIILSKAKGRDVQLVLLFLLSLPFPYYLTVAHIFRYRFPVEPILLIFAAYTLYRIVMCLAFSSRLHGFTNPYVRVLGKPLTNFEK